LLSVLPVPRFLYNTQISQLASLTRSVQYIFACLAVVGVTGALELLRHYYQELNRRQESEKQHIVTELQLLKAQIHPHFFFNTLNTLYGLALEKSEHTPGSILRLSELMHFVLYEAKAKDVPLQRELEIISDYIALEKMRYGERVQVAQQYSGALEDWRIPALLLLPFVENAFKHGVSPETQQAWLNISVQAETHHLKCVVENSVNEQYLQNGPPGLGLENVSRRLELLYTKRYRLDIFTEPDSFMVILELTALPA
jgi:two-component system, LytTR family, sensor kinase